MKTMSGLFCMLGVAVGCLVTGTASDSAAVDVTACGQSFEGVGALTGDLDCTGQTQSAVVIESIEGLTLTVRPAEESEVH